MTGFPDVLFQVAFTSQATDTTPSWEDLTGSLKRFRTYRGRESELTVCDPGTAGYDLDNSDGELDPDNPGSTWAGYIRPNRQVRVVTTVSATPYGLHMGFADSWRRTWPGGADRSMTELAVTDRFKMLARKTVTYSGTTEDADVRIDGLLDAAGVSATDKIVNTDSHAARSLLMPDGGYVGDNALQVVQDASRADGGQLFCNGSGSFVYQTYAWRLFHTRGTTSQATFGNDDDPDTIPVLDDLDPTVDDTLMANRVLVGDGTGATQMDEDTTAQTEDGLLELDLGATLLETTDAGDRATEILDLRKDPTPRYDSVTVDLLGLSDAEKTIVLGLDISDRVTIAVIPPGQTSGTARDQWVESIAHEVEMGVSWMVTFGLSSANGSVTVIP